MTSPVDIAATDEVEDPRPAQVLVEHARRRDRRLALALFAFLVAVYALSSGGHTYSSDEEGLLLTVRGVLERHSPVLAITEENLGLIPAVPGGDHGKPVSASGLATPMFGSPLYLAGAAVSHLTPDRFDDYTERLFLLWTNAFVTALAAVFIFLIGRELDVERRRALVLALVYALGTFAWPHAKTFFTEPSAATFGIGAFYFAVRFRNHGKHVDAGLAGFFLGLAVLGRQSGGLFIPIVCLYIAWAAVWFHGKLRGAARATGWVAAGAVPSFGFLAITNWWRFGSATSLGYQGVPLEYPLARGLYGLFLSPGKSVFLYAPIALVGLAALIGARRWRAEVIASLAMAMANLVFFARFSYWHGDHAWGPRYLIPSLPFLVMPVAAVIGSTRWWRATLVAGVLGFLSAFLGTAIYFNQYFALVEAATPPGTEPDGPAYWDLMHYDPKWSPVVGHARLLDDAVRHSLQRLDGDIKGHGAFPDGPKPRYGWYFAPVQLDSWVYWNFATGAPKALLLAALPFGALLCIGGIDIVQELRRQPS